MPGNAMASSRRAITLLPHECFGREEVGGSAARVRVPFGAASHAANVKRLSSLPANPAFKNSVGLNGLAVAPLLRGRAYPVERLEQGFLPSRRKAIPMMTELRSRMIADMTSAGLAASSLHPRRSRACRLLPRDGAKGQLRVIGKGRAQARASTVPCRPLAGSVERGGGSQLCLALARRAGRGARHIRPLCHGGIRFLFAHTLERD
jgi:hypothetical protein